MKIVDIILAAIPDADEDTIDHVLWGRTPFPFGAITARSLYKEASRYRRACASGVDLCDQCDNRVDWSSRKFLCDRCRNAFGLNVGKHVDSGKQLSV